MVVFLNKSLLLLKDLTFIYNKIHKVGLIAHVCL